MPKLIYLLPALLTLGIFAPMAMAQVPGAAQAEAQSRLVCGTGTVVSAVYLPGGLLQVTCQSTNAQSTSASASQLPTALEGTTLGGGAGAAAVAVLLVVAALGGSDSSQTSSSTSSTGDQ